LTQEQIKWVKKVNIKIKIQSNNNATAPSRPEAAGPDAYVSIYIFL